jgi:chromate transporter
MDTEPGRLREVVLVFLELGAIGFGGPAAHVAMMEDEVVRRRRWVSREHFLDLLGATNLIPGPNSTEMERTGWLDDRQLLDAIAVGQVTPGPVLTTATFIGTLLAGVPGAWWRPWPSFCRPSSSWPSPTR